MPGCAGSPPTGLAGGGDGQPRWPAEPAGRSTTSASAVYGVRRAYGSRSAEEEASDRYRCRRWRDVTDPSERDLGDGLPVRHHR